MHVVYLVKCPCGLRRRQLELRIAEHKAAIHTKNIAHAIARHYIQANHGSPVSLKFCGVERVTTSPRGGDIIKKTIMQRGLLDLYVGHS